MITEVDGNLLDADADALVNAVNTVGVMGKGIALDFRRAFPANYQAYRRACERAEVMIGTMFVVDKGPLPGPRYIINFPTKGHWRSRSELDDIKTGLVNSVRSSRAAVSHPSRCRRSAVGSAASLGLRLRR